jgi:signal transduction histidine kinase
MIGSPSSFEAGEISQREIIHDLRNLFGVIASARRLLGHDQTSERGLALLSAIQDAALRGGEMTTTLLTRERAAPALRRVDLNACLSSVAPLLQAFAGRSVAVEVVLASKPIWVRLDPPQFEAAVLELVRNARSALGAKGLIRVQARSLGKRAWLSVADTGGGMSPAALQRALRAFETASAHGTGLGRIRHLADQAGGHVRIRSREGQGCVIAMIFPKTSSRVLAKPAAHSRGVVLQETRHENRQQAAA